MNQPIIREILRVPVGTATDWHQARNHFLAKTSLANVVVLIDTANPECIGSYIHFPHEGEHLTFHIMHCSCCDTNAKLFFQAYLKEEVMDGN